MGAGSDDKMVKGEKALGSIICRYLDRAIFQIEALGFAPNKFEAGVGVLGKDWLDGKKKLLVGNARDGAPDGGYVLLGV